MMNLAILSSLIAPITRLDCPGSDRLFSLVVGNGNEKQSQWQDAPTKWARGKFHGYQMECQLSDWMDRYTYFHGHFYEIGVQLLLQRLIRSGDRILDIGANIGMLTLLASHLAGNEGIVHAIEPNQNCCDRITRQLLKNKIKNVQLHHLALSDTSGSAELKIAPQHAGFGTLSDLSEGDRHAFSESEHIQTIQGDELVFADSDHAKPISLIKMDIEGYEVKALQGLMQTLKEHRPALVTEVNPYCLHRADTSPAELFELLNELGYDAFVISTHNLRWQPIELTLNKIAAFEGETTEDVLWLHRDDNRNHDAIAPYCVKSQQTLLAA
ncbi:FkbM family methyltransferase [Planctomycetota bacterium]|nr:FkbM family methyltransferase [Planctomycetota bacterium]